MTVEKFKEQRCLEISVAIQELDKIKTSIYERRFELDKERNRLMRQIWESKN